MRLCVYVRMGLDIFFNIYTHIYFTSFYVLKNLGLFITILILVIFICVHHVYYYLHFNLVLVVIIMFINYILNVKVLATCI